jgi:hypothetical protein
MNRSRLAIISLIVFGGLLLCGWSITQLFAGDRLRSVEVEVTPWAGGKRFTSQDEAVLASVESWVRSLKRLSLERRWTAWKTWWKERMARLLLRPQCRNSLKQLGLVFVGERLHYEVSLVFASGRRETVSVYPRSRVPGFFEKDTLTHVLYDGECLSTLPGAPFWEWMEALEGGPS